MGLIRALLRWLGIKKARDERRADEALAAELKAWDQLSDEALRNVLDSLPSAQVRV